MYCVIQEMKLKKPDIEGKSVCIEPYTWGMGEEIYYSYTMSTEKFKRDIKKAYKISIHHSYRENGKVKKKQWVIGTIGYYYIIDFGAWIGDICRLEDKLNDIGISEKELCDLVYAKLDPLVEKIKNEYEQTEEYKTNIKNEKIIRKHKSEEYKFNNKYGGGYNQCYDVFGELKNERKLKQILEDYKRNKEYEEKSRQYQEEYFKRRYSENNNSNYNENKFGGYSKNRCSNYSDEEKKLLKEAFKLLAMKYHPDRGGDNEKMAAINNLKEKIL